MSFKICPDCGKEQDSLNKFCKNCGADLSKVEVIPDSNEISNDSLDFKGSIAGPIDFKVNADDSLDSKGNADDSSEKGDSGSAIKKCPYCGTELLYGGRFCPTCGANLDDVSDIATPQTNDQIAVKNVPDANGQVTVRNVPDANGQVTQRKPIVSAILSIFFPGFGQLYNGQNNKGIIFMILAVVSIVLVLLLIGILIYILLLIWSIIDAYSSAVKLNNGEFVEDKLF